MESIHSVSDTCNVVVYLLEYQHVRKLLFSGWNNYTKKLIKDVEHADILRLLYYCKDVIPILCHNYNLCTNTVL